MIRLIAALAISLCISLGINIAQWRASLIEDARAPLEAQIASTSHQLDIGHAIAAARSIDDSELLRLRADLAAAQGRTTTYYRTEVEKLPAPACAPGSSRVEAWNSIAAPEED